MSTQTILLYQGEQKTIGFTLSQDGLPIDLTGAKIEFQTHTGIGKTSEIDKEITETSDPITDGKITDATAGEFTVFFTQEDTAETYDGTYSIRLYADIVSDDNIIISADNCVAGTFKICYPG